MTERNPIYAHEPDTDQWTDPTTGLLCRADRAHIGRLGHWCGYVAVPSHLAPAIDAASTSNVDVHGGVSWVGPAEHLGGTKWWVGFDCAHSGDLTPDSEYWGAGKVYRDLPFVRAQCAKLAKWVASFVTPASAGLSER
jgi:hypothetical protein